MPLLVLPPPPQASHRRASQEPAELAAQKGEEAGEQPAIDGRVHAVPAGTDATEDATEAAAAAMVAEAEDEAAAAEEVAEEEAEEEAEALAAFDLACDNCLSLTFHSVCLTAFPRPPTLRRTALPTPPAGAPSTTRRSLFRREPSRPDGR